MYCLTSAPRFESSLIRHSREGQGLHIAVVGTRPTLALTITRTIRDEDVLFTKNTNTHPKITPSEVWRGRRSIIGAAGWPGISGAVLIRSFSRFAFLIFPSPLSTLFDITPFLQPIEWEAVYFF
jgi:hypothetical protein